MLIIRQLVNGSNVLATTYLEHGGLLSGWRMYEVYDV